MRLICHLTFDGQCEAAFRVYEECFGGRVLVLLTYGSQGQTSSELRDKIFHATIEIGGQKLTGVDVAPAAYERPQGFAVQMNLDQSSEAKRIFEALAAGGTVHFALQQTSWASHYASLTDRFGVPWEINCGA